MFDLEKILHSAQIEDLVEKAGGKPTGRGTRLSCCCVLHGGDNPTAFSIFEKDGKQYWKCWTGSCGQGDLITFVQVWQNLDFKGACAFLGGDVASDPIAMKESAEQRLEAARIETIAAKEREDARRKELQAAEIHVRYHNNMTQYHKNEWTKAGVDEGMQSFWTLGGCEDFTYRDEENLYHSPTLTIPIFSETRELLTIQHRLLNPHNPKSKYRPERAGLHAHPFLALPELGYDGGKILVMEGAKKAMVTWTRSDSDWQCIGVDSQEMYKSMIEILQPVGGRVIVIPDPNTEGNPNAIRKAWRLAKSIGGAMLQAPVKVDDLILQTDMQQNQLYDLLKQARKA